MRFTDAVAQGWKRQHADRPLQFELEGVERPCLLAFASTEADMVDQFTDKGLKRISTLKEFFGSGVPRETQVVIFDGERRKIRNVNGGSDPTSPILILTLEEM